MGIKCVLGTIRTSGAATISSDLRVDGGMTVIGAFSLDNSFSVSGAATFSDTVAVSGPENGVTVLDVYASSSAFTGTVLKIHTSTLSHFDYYLIRAYVGGLNSTPIFSVNGAGGVDAGKAMSFVSLFYFLRNLYA